MDSPVSRASRQEAGVPAGLRVAFSGCHGHRLGDHGTQSLKITDPCRLVPLWDQASAVAVPSESARGDHHRVGQPEAGWGPGRELHR